MAVNFERSCGYSLPTIDVEHVSASNSVHPYRSGKSPMKGVQQQSTRTYKSKCWHCQGDHLIKDCPTTPQQGPPQQKYKTTKEKQCYLIKTFHKKFQGRKSQINEITPSNDDSFEDLNEFFSEFKSMMIKDSEDSSA